ncbi:HD-GYP domain-containing protein [Marinimicrobium sp. C2-29]|uniref:HD-GYP domain-containing protein n=1 Tax=Marinimicrobium sp. C2-29 TaxID=3139825 RepID=UPI0031393251
MGLQAWFGGRRFKWHGQPAGANDYWEDLLTSLLLMAWFVEARDPYTGGHLWRVSRYAQLMARVAGLSEQEIAHVGLSGFLHDLGKIGIPDEILRKPGLLDDEEFAVIKTHPEQGARLLSGHPLAGWVKSTVLLHHERPDGSGYPKGLSGQDIPDMARVVGVADAFDAMTSARPYRQPMPIEEALDIVRCGRDAQFDARWADVLANLVDKTDLQHIQGHSDEGIPLQECPMCGPTLVVMRHHRSSDPIYCQSCAGEFLVLKEHGSIQAVATGNRGSAEQLEPEADEALIADVVRKTVQNLSFMHA